MAPAMELDAELLHAWLTDSKRASPLLLDVREEWEFELCAFDGALHMPLGELPARCTELDRECELVCICHHGVRSAQAAAYLRQVGFRKVYNLAGGVNAWARRIDSSMPTY